MLKELRSNPTNPTIPSVLKLSALTLVLASSAVASPIATPAKKKTRTQVARTVQADAAQLVAVAYLKALSGQGDTQALDHLLGGATLTAEEFTIPNWHIAARDPVRKEVGDLAAAKREIDRVQNAGREALDGMLHLDGPAADETLTKVDQELAERMMAPSRASAAQFQTKFPVFAYLARADKEVFWHPANPFLATVGDMGDSGHYRAEVHLFRVQEKRGAGIRTWPLRVVRVQADGYDSGFKVLPASSWDPEY